MAAPCANLVGAAVCGAKRAHPVHSKHHPQHHEYLDGSKAGIDPIGKARRRFNESDAGKAYNAVTAALKAGEVACQALIAPNCTGLAEHQHEKLPRGRAGGIAAALRDGPPPIPCCDPCNSYISANPVEAREKGLLLSAKDLI